MRKSAIILLAFSGNSFASYCATNTIPPHDLDKLVQSGYAHEYKSTHQFKMVNTTAKTETYRLCRSLLVNSNYPFRDIKNDCTDIQVAPYKDSGLIELTQKVIATNGPIHGGVDFQFRNVAVSSISGACVTSDMHDSVTTIFV
jgi:hypothetical protein